MSDSFSSSPTCVLDLKTDPKFLAGFVGFTTVSGLISMICAGLLITASYTYSNLKSSDQQAYVVVGVMSLLLSLVSFILVWVLWSKKQKLKAPARYAPADSHLPAAGDYDHMYSQPPYPPSSSIQY